MWTLRKVDQKYQESFEMWRWKSTKKISWTNRVRKEEVLQRVNEERNILHTIQRRKTNWIGHILRRNSLLQHIIKQKITEVPRRGERRHKQLLDDHKEPRRYWKLKEEALNGSVCEELALEEAMNLS
jgi:hypothetical protein